MKISIIGTGSWGLVIGKLLYDNGHQISFWSALESEIELLSRENKYDIKLPGVDLPKDFKYTANIAEVLKDPDMIIMAVPSAFVRSTAKLMNQHIPKTSPYLVSLTKGITEDTLQRMSEVILEEIKWLKKDNMVVLSGPSHAEEVARHIITAVTVACSNIDVAKDIQKVFSNDYFRVYVVEDVIGVELSGSLKNVIAVATGVLDGLGLGDNTKGALITRGLVEITRLGQEMGANVNTFSGLAGMGDLITTCTSKHSRNRYVGEHIGKGESLEEVLAGMSMVAEGVITCRSAEALSKKHHIDMPIVNTVFKVLFEGADVKSSIDGLMRRSLKLETLV